MFYYVVYYKMKPILLQKYLNIFPLCLGWTWKVSSKFSSSFSLGKKVASHFDRKRTEIVLGLGFSLSGAFVTIRVKREEEKLICPFSYKFISRNNLVCDLNLYFTVSWCVKLCFFKFLYYGIYFCMCLVWAKVSYLLMVILFWLTLLDFFYLSSILFGLF